LEVDSSCIIYGDNSHIGNLIAKCLVNKIEEIGCVESTVTKIIKTIKKSPKAYARFKNRAKILLGGDTIGLPSSCKTRWCFLYKIFNAFLINKDVIAEILFDRELRNE
jgi:hypothetical protein